MVNTWGSVLASSPKPRSPRIRGSGQRGPKTGPCCHLQSQLHHLFASTVACLRWVSFQVFRVALTLSDASSRLKGLSRLLPLGMRKGSERLDEESG